MMLKRWNSSTQSYEPFEVPDNKVVVCGGSNPEDLVDCAICGKEITFGDSFSAQTVFVPGTGFKCCICEQCHKEELKHRFSFATPIGG